MWGSGRLTALLAVLMEAALSIVRRNRCAYPCRHLDRIPSLCRWGRASCLLRDGNVPKCAFRSRAVCQARDTLRYFYFGQTYLWRLSVGVTALNRMPEIENVVRVLKGATRSAMEQASGLYSPSGSEACEGDGPP